MRSERTRGRPLRAVDRAYRTGAPDRVGRQASIGNRNGKDLVAIW
jgi:hypothetical protein